ncbi:hypothetical protein GFH48_19855 [Streptomyces fagopyri]|uniref:Uncharacterized protein n=1 Tax=Streptomyces fagopyri TaxID=2662397 RepID=A0A5Q0LDQ1_9ACTN|nr:hypothetical protein [Streptomyces fagopyri]QFZ75222.1 hypothetical protein GFH48_19855 [Streptomyces fagopyri]
MGFFPDSPRATRERPSRGRRAAVGVTAAAAGALAVLLLVPGGEDTTPRTLSADEARRMALAPFRAYEAGPAEVTVRLPPVGEETGTVTVRAIVDHRLRRAVGACEMVDGARTSRVLLSWDPDGVAEARPRTPASGGAPGRTTRDPAREVVTTAAQAVRRARALEPGRWTRRPYSTSPLDRALRLVVSVAADRPGDARRLARSGPLWLREEHLDGHGYGVFSGPRATASPADPSPLTYWIGAGGDLRRVTARVTPGHYATVDFVAARVATGVPGTPWERR